MDTVKIHRVNVPFYPFFTHLLFSLFKGIVVGLFFFGLLAGIVTRGNTDEVDFSVSWFFMSIAGFIFIVRGWIHFKIPCDLAIKERCKLDQLKHSQVEAIPEIRWKNFIQSIGEKAELIEKEVKTDYTRMKKCGYCGRQVHVSSKVGEYCPHCRMQWDIEKNFYGYGK